MFPLQGGTPSTTLYSDDVFSAYTYKATNATQTITNKIDLAGKGGLVWIKGRTNSESHALFDTSRGVNNYLATNNSTQQVNGYTDLLTSFNNNGFTLGADASTVGLTNNGTSINFVSWTFRKAPKFFDVVTYTGNGDANRLISHSLGIQPGFIVAKATSTTSDWIVWHRTQEFMKGYLNTTAAFISGTGISGSPSIYIAGANDTTQFYPLNANVSGVTYVAYLFAHDTTADGIIQCGNFTTNASGVSSVPLGWEPQFILWKRADVGGTNQNDWQIMDSARAFASVPSACSVLFPSQISSEYQWNQLDVNSTGFKTTDAGYMAPSATFIYLAIRRSNKPPTTGTQVYNAIARLGTSVATTVTGVGFAPDVLWSTTRDRVVDLNWHIFDKLRGVSAIGAMRLKLNDIATEITTEASQISSLNMDGYTIVGGGTATVNVNGVTYINHFFKRAPGVFDEVCYIGTASTMTLAHGLSVVPELMIVKGRSVTANWHVYHFATGATKYLVLNSADPSTTNSGAWNNTTPTSSVFSIGSSLAINSSSLRHVAYLFATKAGISKVFSYTGNGTSQTVNCGFTTGARFILIKRTDAAGDWYVWDSTRGIVAGNDPHLSLNSTTAEVTSNDSIDPDTSGFIVNQLAATNINVTSANYIGLALA